MTPRPNPHVRYIDVKLTADYHMNIRNHHTRWSWILSERDMAVSSGFGATIDECVETAGKFITDVARARLAKASQG